MTLPDTINELVTLVNTHLAGKIDFQSPVSVRKSPHSWPVIIHGVQLNDGSNEVWLKDANGEFHKLTDQGDLIMMIAGSLYQRIKYLLSNASKQHSVAGSDSQRV
jgi:hypothetical protein